MFVSSVDVEPPFRNRLLAALPAAELRHLRPYLERVELERCQLLTTSERAVEHVYFLENGIVSVLAATADGSAVETATIGCEGVVGVARFHGVDATAEQACVQIGGAAHRVQVDALRAIGDAAPTLAALASRYSVALFTMAAQNSACIRRHTVLQQCARWLLMAHDRTGYRELPLTHGALSQILGVRRASVTEALGALQRSGGVDVGRACVTVVDAPRLAASACECHDVIRRAVERVYAAEPPAPSLDEPAFRAAAAASR